MRGACSLEQKPGSTVASLVYLLSSAPTRQRLEGRCKKVSLAPAVDRHLRTSHPKAGRLIIGR